MQKRVVTQTVLLVGEGKCELAFLGYLKEIYNHRGCGVRVKIKNAHGKGPENVVKVAIAQSRNADYDFVAAILDTDIPWTRALLKRARQKKVNLVASVPCFEGLILKILRKSVPETCEACKDKCKSLFGDILKESKNYPAILPKELIDARSDDIVELQKIINALTKGRF